MGREREVGEGPPDELVCRFMAAIDKIDAPE